MNEYRPDEFDSMDESASRTAYLIAGFLRQDLSDAERTELDNWIRENVQNQKLFEELTDPDYINSYPAFAGKADKAGIRKKIDRKLHRLKIVGLPGWTWLAAAVLIGLLVTVSFYFSRPATHTVVPDLAMMPEIKPGGDRATLKLGNGSMVILDSLKDGVIANENGVLLNKTPGGELKYISGDTMVNTMQTYNTVTTPRGGQYKVILSDGTRAWLNAASSISYPVSFSHELRKVEVTGEVYFEVAKDKTRPFLAMTRGATIEVLGTHFNINSYDDEPDLKVSLLEGSVKVRTGNQSEMISPGWQAILGPAGNIHIQQADMEQVIAWKDGYFRWSNENIVSIMRQVSRWYDVDVVYEGDIRNENYGGIVARRDSIGKVLRIMESTATVHFKTEGKKVTVMR